MTRPHLAPLNDPVTTIVLNAGSSDVDTVLVDGVVVKRDGRLVGPLAARARPPGPGGVRSLSRTSPWP